MKLPVEICTEAEFPDIHPDHVGRAMPDIIGEASLVGAKSDAPGAVEAVYIDTVNHEYLASGSILFAVPQVYSNGVLKTLTTHYSIIYRDGRTYIRFTSNQGTKKITFNAQGVFVAPWNSTNGYIQNPAYVLLFLLGYIIGVPDSMLDLASFDDMADFMAGLGFETAGKLILQEQDDIEAILKTLLWSFGLRLWESNDGRIRVGRKDISNYATTVHIIRNIDCLDIPKRTTSLSAAINHVQYHYDSIPTASSFKGAGEALRQTSIDAFGELRDEWEFPWITSATMAAWRANEELYRKAFGESTISVRLALEWLDRLDILDSFRFQDPFGPSVAGDGEYGRYFYVRSIEIDLEGDAITVVGEDLQWILQQYFILGEKADLAATWTTAPPSSRMYGYLCSKATGKFSDGEPGKILISKNELGA